MQNANGTPLLAPPPETPNPVFQSIETAIQRTFNSQQPGQRNDWREIEGSYVLFPPSSQQPEAIVHFLGAAYVGAAPSLAYRLFLEALANRNVLVGDSTSSVPSPYSLCMATLPLAMAHTGFITDLPCYLFTKRVLVLIIVFP